MVCSFFKSFTIGQTNVPIILILSNVSFHRHPASLFKSFGVEVRRHNVTQKYLFVFIE